MFHCLLCHTNDVPLDDVGVEFSCPVHVICAACLYRAAGMKTWIVGRYQRELAAAANAAV